MLKMNSDIADMIGVVIPTCGIRDYLWETLESVNKARSKCAPGEVIVCVNAGAESAAIAEIIRKRVGAWAKVEISDPEKQVPLYANWNLCVSKVSRPYVHLLHDDDTVFPNFYDSMRDLIVANPGGALYTCGSLIKGQYIHYNSGPGVEGRWVDAAQKLTKGNFLINPTVILNKSLFDGFDEKWKFVADWNAWHKLALKGEVFCTLQPLACYRLHEGAATSGFEKTGQNILETRKLLESLQPSGVPVDYGFAAGLGYMAAIKCLRNRDFKTAFLQTRLAVGSKFFAVSLGRVLYAAAKAVVRFRKD